MSISRDQLVEVANVAYQNIVATGIGAALAGVGYSEERRLAGLATAQDLQARRQAQQAAKGHQYDLSQQVRATLAARRADLGTFKQAMRTADRLFAEANQVTRLNLDGRLPTSYRQTLPFARTVYETLLADADALQIAAQVGHDQARVEALLQGIADLEELNRQQEQAKGDSQQLTQEVQTLHRAVQRDLRTLRAAVKLAFPGEAERQVLESLRLTQL